METNDVISYFFACTKAKKIITQNWIEKKLGIL